LADARGYVCALAGRRDYYQLPVALAEGGILDALVTDAYYGQIPGSIARLLPQPIVEKLGFRSDARIPGDRVECVWSVAFESKLRRRLGCADWKTFARLDGKLSLHAARQARRRRSNLLLYHPYAWEAFTARYDHAPKKVMFQFHPHPALERRILSEDREKTLVHYSYEEEAGHDVSVKVKQRTWDCWRHADLILCASAFTKISLLEAGADAARCVVVPYGIDLPSCSEGLSAPKAFQALYVGSGTQRKGLHHLLLAWRRATLPPESRLTVVCRFIDPGLEELLHGTSGVELLRGVSGGALQQLFRRSSLLAMPSLVEGFGQVYLEALAQGCPVLGSPNTCLPDIGPSPAIFLNPVGAIDELSVRLEKLALGLPGRNDIRIEARACAERWPWAQFRTGVRAAVGAA
jgi:glycosyltransferase involved in cell wall biosynthesis